MPRLRQQRAVPLPRMRRARRGGDPREPTRLQPEEDERMPRLRLPCVAGFGRTRGAAHRAPVPIRPTLVHESPYPAPPSQRVTTWLRVIGTWAPPIAPAHTPLHTPTGTPTCVRMRRGATSGRRWPPVPGSPRQRRKPRPGRGFRLIRLWLQHLGSGGGGIRTHGRLAPTPVFETGPFDHSGTPPGVARRARSLLPEKRRE
jgi:hypothetical protein